MRSSFSFSRLLQLIRKQGIENGRLYLLSSLALVGLLALVFAFWISMAGPNYQEEQSFIILLFGLFITGSIFASTTFSMLGNKDQGVYWLGFPASHLEKLVCSIFYTTIVFSVVYATSFFIVKMLAIAVIKEVVAAHPGSHWQPIDWNSSNNFFRQFPYFIYAFYAVQALYLLGSVYFSRFSFIITTIIGAVLIFGFVLLMIRISRTFELEQEHYNWRFFSASAYNIRPNGSYVDMGKEYSISHRAEQILLFFIKFAWAPVFWVITWYRLKEKEI